MPGKPGSPTRRRTEGGFTMVEVLIAVLLSVIAVIGVIALFITETKAASYSRRSSEATSLATDKLEKLRTMATATTTGSPETGIDAQGNTGGVFERSWAVTTTTYTDLTVKVGWDDDTSETTTCSVDSTCTSKYCLSTGMCATRAIVLHGRRN